MACYIHKTVYVLFLWCLCSHAFRLGESVSMASVSEERFARDVENDEISTTTQSTNETVVMDEGVSGGTDGIGLNGDGTNSKF